MKFNETREQGIAIRLQVDQPRKKRTWEIRVVTLPRVGDFLDFLTGDREDDGSPEGLSLEITRVVHVLRYGHAVWIYAKIADEKNLIYV
ncbi:MAG: hypothetical protein ACTHOP_03170 [Mesorhizobium sp.]